MENSSEKRVLIVDDEQFNLELLEEDLNDEGFKTVCARNGEEAYEILQKDHNFCVILLDRMMPKMNGMEFINKIKQNPGSDLARIPIIMQTAAASKEQVVEGIKAGVYYYLTKPFDKTIMLSIVRAAASDYGEFSRLKKELENYKSKLYLVKESHFEARTLEDLKYLATFLANYFPEPSRVILGISELLINALEHGNLGITYDMKTQLAEKNIWHDEVRRLQNLPENRDKTVEIHFLREKTKNILTIKDQGKGFNWQKYLTIDPERATHSHGRGIALSIMMSFDEVSYRGNGSEVVCIVNN